MGNTGYDWLEGIYRILKAGEKLDRRWVEVIAYHAALEVELNEMLERTLPRGKEVTGNKPSFPFGHKVAILKAAWLGKPEDADKLCHVLFRFNELRNAVAHPDIKKTYAEIRNTRDAYIALVPDLDHKPEIAEIAQGIVAFMGDGIQPSHLSGLAEGLDLLVNVEIPRALGTRHELDPGLRGPAAV